LVVVVEILAPLTVWAVVVFSELFAEFGPVVKIYVALLSEFVRAMGK
jgi:hypothetical protein